MARLDCFLFFACFILQFLTPLSQAHHIPHHKHVRRSLLPDGRGDVLESRGPPSDDPTQGDINDREAELAEMVSLRDEAMHCLEEVSIPDSLSLDDDAVDGSAPVKGTNSRRGLQEDIKKALGEFDDVFQAVANLLSQYGIQPQPGKTEPSGAASSDSGSSDSGSSDSDSSGPASSGAASSDSGPDGPASDGPASGAASSDSGSDGPASDGPASGAASSDSGSDGPASDGPASDGPASDGPASGPAPYVFDPQSSSNVAVYYSQTDVTDQVSVSTICANPNVDIVVIAFIHKVSVGPAGYPGLNLGANCFATTAAMNASGATELIDCVGDGFAAKLKTCQATGKKVLMAIGGAEEFSETEIESEKDAVRIADNIWDLFGAGGLSKNISEIRPFGDFVFDGFDIDNEDKDTLHWDTLISTMRQHFLDYSPSSDTKAEPSGNSTDVVTKKPYYLTAAPQCPRPDESIPLSSIQSQIDFLFIQFYNNPSCNLNSTDFTSSLEAWSKDVIDPPTPFVQTGNGVTSPRVYVGGAAFPAAGSGWVRGPKYLNIMSEVPELGLPNLGGASFWDGAYGILSARGSGPGTSGLNRTYMALAKEALT